MMIKKKIIKNKKDVKKESKLNTKDLGFISSIGGDTRNGDYFNIFSKSALFDYDTAKKIEIRRKKTWA